MRRPGRRGVRRSGRRTCRGAIEALAFALALLACTSVARADWNALGDTVNPGPSFLGQRPDVADVGGTPYVAWRELIRSEFREELRVSRWTGTAWQPVGQPLNSTADFRGPSITSAGGVPYVAFVENPADTFEPAQLRVAKLNATGDGWVDAGGGSLNHDPVNGDARDIAIGTVGSVPYVAFNEKAGDQWNLWVKKLESGSWVAVGGQLNTSPFSAFAPDVVGVAGVPYVSWVDDGHAVGMGAESGLRVSRFTGSSWTGVGDRLREDSGAGGSLTDVGGLPTILFTEDVAPETFTFVVQQWDGSSWNDLGTPHSDPFNDLAYDLGSIATIGGAPYVALPIGLEGRGQIVVLTYDGTSWTQVGSPLSRSAEGDPLQPVIAAAGGDVIVAWREQDVNSSDDRIHASWFDVSPSPETSITGNSTATNAGAATYAFTAIPPAGATFECSYDNAPFAPCTSPHTSGVLSPGAHNFRVRATNANGTDPTPASRDFIVDRVAPTTTIRLDGTRTVSGAYAGMVTVEADVTDPALSSGPRSKFCVVDPPTPPTSFGDFASQPCGVVVTAIGNHTAYAIANDQAGNVSAISSASFRIVPAPNTTITSGPTGPSYSLPRFTFASDVAGATFECSIDGGPFVPCVSPFTPVGQALGEHLLSVRATSPEGLTDPSPAQYGFILAERTVSNSCSFLIAAPGGGRTLQRCVVLNDTCPAGSICTARLDPHATAQDFGYTHEVEMHLLRNGANTPDITAVCWSNGLGSYGLSCPNPKSASVIGPVAAISIDCTYNDYVIRTFDPQTGSDDARRATCQATYSIRPAASLTTVGAGDTVTIFAPGAGTVAISALATPFGALAVAQARPLKPPFKPASQFVSDAGPVTFELKLSRTVKRELRKTGESVVPVTITFTPADGSAVETANEQVTLTAVRKLKKPKRERD
jgi:hypothetical protein